MVNIFSKISQFADNHNVNIELEFNCLGDLLILMVDRDYNESSCLLTRLELTSYIDFEEFIILRLVNMLEEIESGIKH